MRFSRLEIKGFKSFANETVIHFNEDVTGIVGPNGSGKSNIVDAIRWVLGEQKSTELRLEKMSNVIFNGTRTRKPAGMAQVSLVFENNKNILPIEFNEVTVSRVLYQSGESEYKLNNVTCRLKDIHSLFVDTGIGSNTYAIIGYGMVEDLLNNKDNYRRIMIEQAAGVSKFKSRKKETLAKLLLTIEDLNRVDDLLAEIASNMGVLAKQAKRAEKYLALKEVYKEKSAQLFAIRKKSVEESIRNCRLHFENEVQHAGDKELAIHQLENKLEIDKNTLLTKEEALSDIQKNVNALLDEQKSYENKKALDFQRISFIKSKSEHALREIEQIKANIDDLDARKTGLVQLLPQYETETVSLREEIEAHRSHLDKLQASIQLLESNLAPVISDYNNRNTELIRLEREMAIAHSQLLNLQTDFGKNKAQEDQLEKDLLACQTKMKALQTEKETVADNGNNVSEAIRTLNLQKEEITVTLQSLKEEKSVLDRQLDSFQHESKLLKSLIENFEGYPEAVKFLSTNIQQDEPLPILADLINTKPEYRTCLENFLSPYLAYFVVNTYKEAFRAIDLLTSAQKGKAGFFVLEALNQIAATSHSSDQGIRLSSIIECHPKYLPVFDYLLANTFLVDEITPVLLAIMASDPALRYVTIDGAVTVALAQVAGGSIGLIEGNLLGRKLRLDHLEEEIFATKKQSNALLEKIMNHQLSLKDLDVITEKQRELELVNQKLRQLEKDELQWTLHSDNLQSQLTKLRIDEQQFKDLMATHSATIATHEMSIHDLKASLVVLHKSLDDDRSQIKEISDAYTQISNEINTKNLTLIQQENKTNNLSREIEMLSQQKNTFDLQITQHQALNQQSILEISVLESNTADLESSIIEIAGQYKGSREKLSEAEKLYFNEKKHITELEQQIRVAQKELTQIQTLANEWKDKLQVMTFESNRIEDNFKIEFGFIPDEVMADEIEGEQLDELELTIHKLKTTFQQFGEVNPLALEAYNDIKQRYDEIVTQKNDILESKEKLAQTIQELETTSTTKYLAAYEKIRDNFKMVFRSLFTEDDDCDLLIEEPGKPLDSDIVIIAKPKGKRPQSLNQLSGGEKTLTAIAFLFALYLLKPAPFCIFDELDAPLDDVNVEKLNKIIRKFSAKSQFIIITHNKATMAAVDIMYGVYMEQLGISGLSKVDFRSLEHNIVLEASDN